MERAWLKVLNGGGNLVNVDDSSLALADFDNDGKLDFSIIGCCDIHRIYRNNGSTFIEINREITGDLVGIFAGSQAFGDYNNDGYFDLIVNGRESYTTLYLYNVSSTNFTSYSQDPESHILDVYYSSLAWVDLDNDTDLDLIETGYGGGGGGETQIKVYISNTSSTKNNTKPTPPNTSFASSYSDGVINLSWGNGSDFETNTSGLYYNLMVGNSTTNNTIVSGIYGGSSNPTAGYFGNMMERESISLTNNYLSSGTYNWYVQTIDTGLQKSNWSVGQSLVIGADVIAPNISGISSTATSSTATITWTTNETSNSSVYYGATKSTTSTQGSSSLVISHSVGLAGLSASTFYYYNVSSCDYFGNCNISSQYNFTTSATPITPPGGGGSGGGGGSPTTETLTTQPKEFDIDFSVTSSSDVEAKQGEIKTFSFNSQTTHKISITEITSTSAKLIIESEPIILILNIGETKQIDVNKDNINDFEIKLISILDGKAKFSLNKLEGADIVAQEELKKEVLFDVKISILDKFKKVFPGEEVAANIEVFNVNNIGQVDVRVDYYISDKENEKVLTRGFDTLAVEAVTSFVRFLKVPEDVKPGTYLFNVDISYKDIIVASSSKEFEVQNRTIGFIEKKFREIIIIIIILISIIFYLIFKLKRRKRRKLYGY